MIDVRFKRYEGNKVHVISVRVRIPIEVRCLRSSARAAGGDRSLHNGVGVMFPWSFQVRLLLVDFSTSVRAVRNGHALRAVMEMVVRSRRDRHRSTLLSVLSTGAPTPASREGITDRSIKREGWWRPTQRKCMTAVVSDNIGNGEVEWCGIGEEPG